MPATTTSFGSALKERYLAGRAGRAGRGKRQMPWDAVMSKFKRGALHSGSKKGPSVKNRKQAIAIMLSEKRAAAGGKKEYQPSSSPMHKLRGRMKKKR